MCVCVCVCVCARARARAHVHSVMSDSATPWTVPHLVPLSMEFSKQEYWNTLPFPSPGDLPNPRTEPTSPALVGEFFTTEPPRKPLLQHKLEEKFQTSEKFS